MSEPRLRLGIAGLGQAFMLMMPTLRLHPRIEIAGAADSREAARQQFQSDFDRPAFASVEELCRQPTVDAIYIMTPHQYHAEHAAVAAAHGKHVLVEKPMALDLASCRSMIAATAAAGVQLVVGHTSCCVTVAIGAAIRAGGVQRRFCPAAAPLPSPPIAGVAEAFARSAAVFFGFFASRFDLFCPFAICVSNVRPPNRSVSADRFAIYTATDVRCSMM